MLFHKFRYSIYSILTFSLSWFIPFKVTEQQIWAILNYIARCGKIAKNELVNRHFWKKELCWKNWNRISEPV